jgi:hypothetical protein
MIRVRKMTPWIILLGVLFVLMSLPRNVRHGHTVAMPDLGRVTSPRYQEAEGAYGINQQIVSARAADLADTVEPETLRNLKTHEIDTSTSHGTSKHPYEADAIRKCLDDNGPAMMFKSNRWFLRVCDLGRKKVGIAGTWFGVQVLARDLNGAWFEITAYVPKLADPTLNGIRRFVLQGEVPWSPFGG